MKESGPATRPGGLVVDTGCTGGGARRALSGRQLRRPLDHPGDPGAETEQPSPARGRRRARPIRRVDICHDVDLVLSHLFILVETTFLLRVHASSGHTCDASLRNVLVGCIAQKTFKKIKKGSDNDS